MIVQVYGLPGSGKSTLVRALVTARHDAMEVTIRGKAEKCVRLLQFLVSHPICFLYWIRKLFVNSDRMFFRYKASLLFTAMAKEAKARNIKEAVVLVDEGLYQRILSIFENELSEREAEEAIRNVPNPPDLIAALPGGSFNRFETAEDRGDSPRFKHGEEYMRKWRAILQKNDEIVRGEIRKAGIRMVESDQNHLLGMLTSG